jgi:hypothetical protein
VIDLSLVSGRKRVILRTARVEGCCIRCDAADFTFALVQTAGFFRR